MSDALSLGELMREKRTAAGLTLREVADMLGLSVPYLSDVELGNRELRVSRWKSLTEKIPGLTLRSLAEAAIATGPIEIDARSFSAAQRRPVVDALVRSAEETAL